MAASQEWTMADILNGLARQGGSSRMRAPAASADPAVPITAGIGSVWGAAQPDLMATCLCGFSALTLVKASNTIRRLPMTACVLP